MNRRNFISNLLKVGAAFAILPSATTYARKWVQTDSAIVVPVSELTTGLNFVPEGRLIAQFKYYVLPLHYEFARVYFHAREQFNQPTPCLNR